MNERITELARQCASEDHLAIYNSSYARFAELIVRECAITAYLCSHADCHSGDEFIHAGDKIRKHFGVEE